MPVRNEGVEPFSMLRHEIDRLFDDFSSGFRGFSEPFLWIEERSRQFSPAVDASESDEDVIFNVELPGIDEKDIELSLADGHLIIRGEKKEKKEENRKGYYRTERSFGKFYRVIAVPSEVDTEKISAEYNKGLLSIRIPKTEKARARVKKIPVKAN